MSEKQTESYKLHAIQLIGLKVQELFIVISSNYEEDETSHQSIDEGTFTWNIGYSEYDQIKHQIALKVSIIIGDNEKDSPFSLKVSLLGIFEVDESRFPLMHIEHWAKNNVPLVLYPYLREHVYSLTSRAGLKGVILPLFEVPTFRISKELDKKTTPGKI